MDDREAGFLLVHRRLYSSPVWRSLTKGQRWVLLSVLILANFRRKPLGYFGGELVYVERGELAHEVEKIAAHAEESYATARKAIEKMLSFGFIEVRWSFGANNRVRILRVVNYERYQGAAQQPRNESDDDRATTAQQPRNERTREQGEQEKRAPAPEASSLGTSAVAVPAPAAGPVLVKTVPAASGRARGMVSPSEQMARPYASALFDLLAETWPEMKYAPGPAAVALDKACQERGGTAAFALACREFAERKGVTPGSTQWFAACLADIGRATKPPERKRHAMGAVGTDWDSKPW